MFFCIPLLPRGKAADWALIGRLLDGTLRSLAGQTRGGFEVLLARHELPDGFDDHGVPITHIEADYAPDLSRGSGSRDRGRKKRLMEREVARRGGGYVMSLDADDRVSNRLVAHVEDVADPHGYVAETGWALSYASRQIAPLPGAWPGPFSYYCGSCAVLKVSPDDLEDRPGAYWRELGSHVRWAKRSADAGRPLSPFPFPAVVYLQNTGENNHAKIDSTRKSEAEVVIDAAAVPLTSALVDEFALHDILERP